MSSSFHEIQFPPSISQGAVGGPRFSTTVLTLSSGAEHRNINWAQQRGEWDVSHGLKTQEQIDQLLAFFYARRGKAYGFRFKDWSDYRLPRWRTLPGDIDPLPVFFTTNGSTASFQLVKTYTDAGGSFVRPIYKPVAGTLQLYNNGVATSDYTVNTTTGIVTLGNTTKATTGHLITGYCEFDVPARFDTDDMKITVTTTEIFQWGPISVVETREIA
jgi:uncharacterized protein (TIGR02217 family)